MQSWLFKFLPALDARDDMHQSPRYCDQRHESCNFGSWCLPQHRLKAKTVVQTITEPRGKESKEEATAALRLRCFLPFEDGKPSLWEVKRDFEVSHSPVGDTPSQCDRTEPILCDNCRCRGVVGNDQVAPKSAQQGRVVAGLIRQQIQGQKHLVCSLSRTQLQ